MKAATVHALVNAQADWMRAREAAMRQPNETTCLRLRLEAAEELLVTIGEALLAGTSADPAKVKK